MGYAVACICGVLVLVSLLCWFGLFDWLIVGYGLIVALIICCLFGTVCVGCCYSCPLYVLLVCRWLLVCCLRVWFVLRISSVCLLIVLLLLPGITFACVVYNL